MSLYDDEVKADTSVAAAGWSSGVNKIIAPQQKPAATTALVSPASVPVLKPPPPSFRPHVALPSSAGGTNTGASRSAPTSLPPVININKKNQKRQHQALEDDTPRFIYSNAGDKFRDKTLLPLNDPIWTPVNEYDPLWPNDYHKVVQDLRGGDKRERSPEDNKKRRYTESGREKARERFLGTSSGGSGSSSGFARRPGLGDYSDDEDDDTKYARRGRDRGGSERSRAGPSGGGAAIAPPPSLNEDTGNANQSTAGAAGSGSAGSLTQKLGSTLANPGLGVAAKIMAKYGYKHGQGLGKDEQGISQALSVEKTSKRGGRIIHEKDLIPPPPVGAAAFGDNSTTPPHVGMMPPPVAPATGLEYGDAATGIAPSEDSESNKPSITDLMKNPGKVVLCKNMVGPGEVDAELEPEVQEECHGKYGEVHRVVIHEVQNAPPEEAVRIFIEFKRVESAIKAVVDLNGRFFGGRMVQACFYDAFKFNNSQFND